MTFTHAARMLQIYRRAVASVLVALLATIFTTIVAATSAFAASPNIVISQVYGGGGNTGSVYKNDFIELFNRGITPVSVNGWSVQYASATGTAWSVTTLPNITIPAGGYFLVQQVAGTGGTTSLPTPDAVGTTAMSGTAGKVALVNVTTALAVACPAVAAYVDFVGYGATANCSETAATPAPSNSNSVSRAANGCTDGDNNGTDFTAGAANPRNSGSATNSCSSLPSLTINNVTANEGGSGVTSFTFTVMLSAAAPAGGVTFDIATANNTATAGSDYTAKTLTAQTIPAGSTSYAFTVDVLGDITPEADETFFVNVTNVVNANIVTGQGVGTITNDDAAASLTINDVALAEGNSGTTTFTFTVSLSAPAPGGGVTFDIATADGTATAGSDYVAKTLAAQTIPAGSSSYTFDVLVNGDTVGEPNETFFVNITNVANAIPLDAQGLGTILNDDATPIHSVQGSGTQSPLAGASVTIEGIVTADFQGPNQLKGFYVQAPDAEADADPATSEGMFIYTNLAPYAVALGDRVRVTATVIEFGTSPNTLTEMVTPTITTLSSGNVLPEIVDVALPVTTVGDLERYESMRVRFTQSLTVSDNFDLAHFGEITLSVNGRSFQPTSEVDPNDAVAAGTTSSGNSNAAAVTAYENLNTRSSILLDDASTLTYPATIPFADPVERTLRLGSTVSNLTGVLSQSFGAHRLYATVAPEFSYAPRPATPPNVGGNVKIASANVLNYFNGDGLGGGFPTARGANSANEFARQRAKTVAALTGLNADVVGLLEMENDGTGPQSAIQDLINGLNAAAGAGTWNFVADPVNYGSINGGTDAIRPVFIYKTAVVAPVGLATALNDAAFVQARAPVAQTFRLLSNNEQFVAVINHFKSKGGTGTGLDADQNDGQAAFNNSRKLQAAALLGFINTLAATTPRVITMGDFNAYEQEDPIDVMRAGGLSTIVNNNYSYMFNGLSGSLDHALGNAALMAVISGSGKWHINADEPVYLDYNVETKNTVGCTSSCTTPDYFAATPFRASDHDPVLVGLNLIAAQTVTFPAITSFAWSGGTSTLGATASSGLAVTYSVVSGPCAVAGTTVTALGGGACVIAANQAGNASYNAAPQVTQSVTVSAAAQTITFPAIAGFFAGSSSTLAATASSGLAVSYSVTAGSCTLSGSTVSASTAGSCTIAANQAGNTNFLAATTVSQTVTVSAALLTSQTINFPSIANQVGTLRSILISGGTVTSLLTATFTSLTPNICAVTRPLLPTIPPPGTPQNPVSVTLIAYGSCTIRAAQPGDATFAAAPNIDRSFTISNTQGELTLAANLINPRAGTPITLTALVRGIAPNGLVSFTTTPITDITNSTIPVVGCTNLSVSLLPADNNAAVVTCTTFTEAGARRYTATYSGDSANALNPVSLTTNSPAIGPQDYNDIWWAGAAESGWGMTIAQKGLQQFNAFYVYDATGKPVWYVMSGGTWNADYTRFTSAIYQPTGAVFSNYDVRRWQVGAAVGSGTLTFTNTSNAVFDFTINGVTAKKNIARFGYGTPDALPKIVVRDMWWAGEAENGWGVAIAQQDRSLFATWYTYGADGKATWFVMSGGTWVGTTYSGPLYTAVSSGWLGVPYNAAAFNTQLVGSVSFDFRDASTAKMTYTVNGLNGLSAVTQTKVITRLGF